MRLIHTLAVILQHFLHSTVEMCNYKVGNGLAGLLGFPDTRTVVPAVPHTIPDIQLNLNVGFSGNLGKPDGIA